jgi:hypothetical protein
MGEYSKQEGNGGQLVEGIGGCLSWTFKLKW